jgi:hypothetical protein
MSRPTEARELLPRLQRRHLRLGWGALVVYTGLGLLLEVLHGFKIPWYLSVATETRRLMWTLAHAHGTLLGLVNLALAATVALLAPVRGRALQLASSLLASATVLLPLGFFLGGVFVHGGDPGLGSLLVPPGALLLLVALVLIWRRAGSSPPPD